MLSSACPQPSAWLSCSQSIFRRIKAQSPAVLPPARAPGAAAAVCSAGPALFLASPFAAAAMRTHLRLQPDNPPQLATALPRILTVRRC